MKLSKERQEICRQYLALALHSPERTALSEQHSLRAEELFYYKRDYQSSTRTRATATKIRTRQLLIQQNRCALCDKDIPAGTRSCLDRTGKVVCCTCNQFLTLQRRLHADGITDADIEEFNQNQ